jgi:hypothetical protein
MVVHSYTLQIIKIWSRYGGTSLHFNMLFWLKLNTTHKYAYTILVGVSLIAQSRYKISHFVTRGCFLVNTHWRVKTRVDIARKITINISIVIVVCLSVWPEDWDISKSGTAGSVTLQNTLIFNKPSRHLSFNLPI